ncbi:odorant receptor 4-like isoform X3 [Apis laboriosa]|uniref:odorant receptor 4-like isoform X3 n=1 Tax=Apis laboriosa TaxID=183418 RepID=UPI001CC7CD8E|nr:odorant receptor 4-like isoform X3 [Apis laboriosa]
MQTESQLDISINLSTFFLKNVGVWMSDNPSEQRRIKMLFLYTMWNLLFSTVVNSRDLYFTLLYDGDILYATTNNITMIMAQSGNNESERMLPFNMWINLPVSKTPYYEITFFIQATCVYYVGISYFCFDNIFCIMAIHLAGQFRILRYRFTKLCDIEYENSQSILSKQMHKFYEKFRKCVQHHQALIDFYQNLENVYTMITLGQVLVFSVLICLFGYQVLVATISFARRFIFVFMLNGSMFLLFMVTYSCNGVIEHSDNVAIGAYSALWTIMPMDKFGKIFRKDLIIVIRRSRRVCCLTANGFFPVSLETYTKILSTALSYFTLLSNRIENNS